MTESERDVVVLGEALIDIVRTPAGAAESPGGSPANVAVALGRLGRATTLVTRLAADDRGRRLVSWLEASGVDVLVGAAASRTSVADAVIDGSGDASYSFDIEWELPAPLELPSAHVVHTGSIASYVTPGSETVAAVVTRARGESVVTFDPNIRASLAGDRDSARSRIERLVRVADVVKASDEDLRWLYPDTTPERVARSWLSLGPALVAVTQGAGGVLAVSSSGVARVATARVDVVDTVGAGDTFMGALIDSVLALAEGEMSDAVSRVRSRLAGLTHDETVRILTRCAAAAAVTVSRVGMDPPRRAELDPDPIFSKVSS